MAKVILFITEKSKGVILLPDSSDQAFICCGVMSSQQHSLMSHQKCHRYATPSGNSVSLAFSGTGIFKPNLLLVFIT